MLETFTYLFVSGFTIWFVQSQKIFERIFFNEFLKELRKCGICLGFWVCLLFQFIFEIGLLDKFDYNFYTHIVNVILTASVSSLVIFLVVKGHEFVYGVTRL